MKDTFTADDYMEAVGWESLETISRTQIARRTSAISRPFPSALSASSAVKSFLREYRR